MHRALIGLLSVVLLSSPLHAQSLEDHFRQLFTFGQCGEPLCLDVGPQHGRHFIPDVVQGESNMLAFVTDAIGLSISNIPFTAATSGVTFSFEQGVPVATAVSPGPIFAERAETLGKGRFLVGANVSGISFDNVRGVPLERLQLNFTHENVGDPTVMGDEPFERDILTVTTALDLSLVVSSVFASFGVTDRVDVGVAIPIVHASLSGRSVAQVVKSPTYSTPTPHTFDGDAATQATSSASASATGLGDITARLKLNLRQTPTIATALLADVRLPTGRVEDFLGSGATTVRVLGIVSGRSGNFSPHANAGILYTNAESQNNRLLATLGFDQLLSEFATLAVDLVTSFETADSKMRLPAPVVFESGDIVQLTDIPHRKDNFIDASFGMKFSPAGDNRVVTNVLFPLIEGGVRPGLMWTLGFERSF